MTSAFVVPYRHVVPAYPQGSFRGQLSQLGGEAFYRLLFGAVLRPRMQKQIKLLKPLDLRRFP
jgi:hypothetical protein